MEKGRWNDYVLLHDAAFEEFWRSRLLSRGRDVLFVLFKGFDPRSSLMAESIVRIGGQGKRDCVAIELDEGPTSPSAVYQAKSDLNWMRVEDAFAQHGPIELRTIRTLDERKRRIGARAAGSLFTSVEELRGYSDIVIDASALPKEIAFPLIGNVLNLADQALLNGVINGRLNIHVCVAEDPDLDNAIVEQGVDEVALLIHGFGGAIEREANTDLPRVWIPLLGENQSTQLERIRELVRPVETCPALPSPARNPRRADNLVAAYHELLFDDLQVDPDNFLFVSERNPFEAYRTIRRVVLHYCQVLQPLGGCKVVLSALSSKLLSFGAFLVAYELSEDVGVAHVGSEGFTMEPSEDDQVARSTPELFDLWIEGDCYDK